MADGHQNMGWLLQHCLERIQFGGAKVDQLLWSYPEFADELCPLLDAAMWLMARKTALNPRPEFLCDTWIWLISQR
jgi:hypothetical protein